MNLPGRAAHARSGPNRAASPLSVVIVSYETRDLLDRSLRSLRKAVPPRTEVVVVDNASSDGSAAMVERNHPWARVVELPRNRGFAAGVNEGVRATTGEAVLVLNPDVVVDRAGVDTLLTALDADQDAAAISPLLIGHDGKPQGEMYRRFPGPAQVLLFWSFLAPMARRIGAIRRRWLEHPIAYRQRSSVDQLPGGALLLRRSALEAVGPLDEGYFIWFEDVDWCYRARQSGWQLLVEPRASFRHEGGASFRRWTLDHRALQFYRAGLRFLRKHHLDRSLWIAGRVVPKSLHLHRLSSAFRERSAGLDRCASMESIRRVIRELDRDRDVLFTGAGPADIAVGPSREQRGADGPTTELHPDVDVVIVNWNGRRYLGRCISAVLGSTARVSVTVVDNASDDGSVDYLRREWPSVRVVSLEANRGYAEAANVGLRSGSARYAFVMNPDLLVEADHLGLLRDRLDACPEVGAAQGKLYRIDDERFLNGGDPPREVLDSAGQRIGRTRMAVDRGQGERGGGSYDREASVFSACGAALFLRREMLHDLAPNGPWFDPSFFAYKEDVDLGWRARLHGWDIRYVPGAEAHHVRAVAGDDFEAWRKLPSWVREHSWKNHYLMILKNDRISGMLRSLPWIAGWEIARLGHVALREPGLLRAYSAVLRNARCALRSRRQNLSAARRRRVDLHEWFGRDAKPVLSERNTPRAGA